MPYMPCAICQMPGAIYAICHRPYARCLSQAMLLVLSFETKRFLGKKMQKRQFSHFPFISDFAKIGQIKSFGDQEHLSLLPALNAVAPLPPVVIVDLLVVHVASPPRVLTRQPDVEAGVVPPTSTVLVCAIFFPAVIVVTVPEQR